MDQETLEVNALTKTELTDDSETTGTSIISSVPDLNKESLDLIQQIISETDEQKAKNLTYLFNLNQNKKTMVRVNKLSDLLDTITTQALTRFTARPEEISNKELFDGLKVVQDLIERGQKQVTGATETPLIQFNQQNNEVNLGDATNGLNRESRERVKTAVLDFLGSLSTMQNDNSEQSIIESTVQEAGEVVND